MKLHTIVFDLDGTLIDSGHLMESAFNYALSIYNMQVTVEELETMRSLTSAELFRDRLDETKAKVAVKRLWDYSHRSITDTLLIEGIKPILEQLKNKKITMGIWTGRDRASALRIIKHHKIDHFFKALVGGCEVSKNKPSPEGLLLLAQQLNVSLSSLMHVGDHDHDVLGAMAAGVKCALVGWCSSKLVQQPTQRAHFNFNSVDDFSQWIEQFK
ncbi:HAD family hydrolase [Legionella sp. D16C41]|uniref:HAD family hydrolase n=1 Tax=Legionella sp. D16C41 TaxID=3402688 RepID=UPI003AF76A17